MPPVANKPTTSALFSRLYQSLPEEAQREIIDNHIVPLLEAIPRDQAAKILDATSGLHLRHAKLPVLDLKEKRREVKALMDELAKDSKRSFIQHRSKRIDLLKEILDSLSGWLNDIWTVVYEYNVNFAAAHSCLLYAAGVLDHLSNKCHGGCNCSFNSIFVPITIKSKQGKVVKKFSHLGDENLREAMLWIWRELFLSLLATGKDRDTKVVAQMLSDIEDIMGCWALERLLHGGKGYNIYDDSSEDEDNDDEGSCCCDSEDEGPYCDEDRSGDSCPMYATHWPDRITRQIFPLRSRIQRYLQSVFETQPTIRLYTTLLNLSEDETLTRHTLMHLLTAVAPITAGTITTALSIHTLENRPESIRDLLETHSHFLRPRDFHTLVPAALILSRDLSTTLRALELLEHELLDTLHTINSMLSPSFSCLSLEKNTKELQAILKLRVGSAARHTRVQQWVDAVSTPGSGAPNPLVFAAVMMGLPLPPGVDGDGDASSDPDPLGYLDADALDPDLEDLRDEFRPMMKERWEAWTDVAISMKGGALVLLKVYKEVLEVMPFMRGTDIVEDMIGRLADKPSKHNICDALDALSTFSKGQRKKMISRRKREDAAVDAAMGQRPGAFDNATPSGLNAPSSVSPQELVGIEALD